MEVFINSLSPQPKLHNTYMKPGRTCFKIPGDVTRYHSMSERSRRAYFLTAYRKSDGQRRVTSFSLILDWSIGCWQNRGLLRGTRFVTPEYRSHNGLCGFQWVWEWICSISVILFLDTSHLIYWPESFFIDPSHFINWLKSFHILTPVILFIDSSNFIRPNVFADGVAVDRNVNFGGLSYTLDTSSQYMNNSSQ